MPATDGELLALALVTSTLDETAPLLELVGEVQQSPDAVRALALMVILLLPSGEELRRQKLQHLAAAFVVAPR